LDRTGGLECWMIRQGFLPGEVNQGINTEWLQDTLTAIGQLSTDEHSMTETEWIDALQQTAQMFNYDPRVPGKETLIHPKFGELPLIKIDPYIRGIVRWLNMLGIYTIISCDGEGRGRAYVGLLEELTAQQVNIIRACTPDAVRVRFRNKEVAFFYPRGKQEELLTIAERLYEVWKNPARLFAYRLEKLKKRLINVLSVNGSSGRERNIRRKLYGMLKGMVDWLEIDAYGNLLGQVNCGEGPVVLLSAHMDTVQPFPSGRAIQEDGHILRSTSGILGADDRTGVAIVLEMLESIRHSKFQGTLKVAFTVEEEIGCRGARNIERTFLEDVDAAIVLDRKGNRDIVIAYGDTFPFCHEEYGTIFQRAGALLGMADWRLVAGGSSDARVFAEQGIPTVNLSVGYYNPHTDDEMLDCRAALQTVLLLEKVLNEQFICGEVLTSSRRLLKKGKALRNCKAEGKLCSFHARAGVGIQYVADSAKIQA